MESVLPARARRFLASGAPVSARRFFCSVVDPRVDSADWVLLVPRVSTASRRACPLSGPGRDRRLRCPLAFLPLIRSHDPPRAFRPAGLGRAAQLACSMIPSRATVGFRTPAAVMSMGVRLVPRVSSVDHFARRAAACPLSGPGRRLRPSPRRSAAQWIRAASSSAHSAPRTSPHRHAHRTPA